MTFKELIDRYLATKDEADLFVVFDALEKFADDICAQYEATGYPDAGVVVYHAKYLPQLARLSSEDLAFMHAAADTQTLRLLLHPQMDASTAG